ncbi:MAG TPA: hypothetical protein VNB29_05930 [Chthoniobacterales bacterium]|nr:hypothetical protein [Chthoniobacterales bacterium]
MTPLAIRRPGRFPIFNGEAELQLLEEGGRLYYLIVGKGIRARSLNHWSSVAEDWFIYPKGLELWLFNGKELAVITLVGKFLDVKTLPEHPDLLSRTPRYVRNRIEIYERQTRPGASSAP